MNAILQCFGHIERFTKYFLNDEQFKIITSNKSNYKLSYAYLELLYNLWINNNNNNIFSSENIRLILGDSNLNFNNNIKYNYSNNFLILFFEKLHQELNKKNDMINQVNISYNQYDYNSVFTFVSNNFGKNYNSIISILFYGMYNGMMQCYNCNITTHNVQLFYILTFPLNEVQPSNNQFQNEVNILDCFNYYQNPKYNYGENQIFCNNCQLMTNSSNSSKLLYTPKVLIINLIKGENKKLKFEEYLYIKNYVYYKQSYNYYQLNGIVTLINHKNYVAFCKSFINGNWYQYNNQTVRGSSFDEARTTGIPYYLFYSYIKVQSQ